MIDKIKESKRPIKVLNLFAYTGAASLAARAAGADVTHLDSVRQVVTWANGNMERSGMKDIRWRLEIPYAWKLSQRADPEEIRFREVFPSCELLNESIPSQTI